MLAHSDVPPHQRYPFILTGYRKPLNLSGCIWSVFQIHNETVNIWTNLITFLILMYSCFSIPHFIAAIGFLSSAVYHTFSATTADTSRMLNNLDYVGIFLIGFAVACSAISAGARDIPNIRVILHCANFINCAIGIWSIFAYNIIDNKHLRIYSIAFCASIGFIMILTFSVVKSYHVVWVIIRYFITMGFGACIYSLHCPERYFSAESINFDLFGQSHNLWHVFSSYAVIIALNEMV